MSLSSGLVSKSSGGNLPGGPKFCISSSIAEEHAAELETLFYFNANQWKLRKSVETAVKQYGAPQILNVDGKLRFDLPKLPQAQTLYLYEKEDETSLIGVVVYVREQSSLKVLYWALKPEYTHETKKDINLLLEFVNALRAVGRRIVGIKHICFSFGSREYKLRI